MDGASDRADPRPRRAAMGTRLGRWEQGAERHGDRAQWISLAEFERTLDAVFHNIAERQEPIPGQCGERLYRAQAAAEPHVPAPVTRSPPCAGRRSSPPGRAD